MHTPDHCCIIAMYVVGAYWGYCSSAPLERAVLPCKISRPVNTTHPITYCVSPVSLFASLSIVDAPLGLWRARSFCDDAAVCKCFRVRLVASFTHDGSSISIDIALPEKRLAHLPALGTEWWWWLQYTLFRPVTVYLRPMCVCAHCALHSSVICQQSVRIALCVHSNCALGSIKLDTL